VLRDALMELRAEGAAVVPSGSPNARSIPEANFLSESELVPEAAEPSEKLPPGRPGEYLMGPVQIATVAFVGITLISVVSAGFYLVGRRHGDVIQPKFTGTVPALPAPNLPAVARKAAPAPAPTPVLVAKPAPAPVALATPQLTKPELRKFYLQLISIELGVAEVMVYGLRQKGVPAMVSPGINDSVTRVLVGPLSDAAAVAQARGQVEALGFRPFNRVFTEQDFLPPPRPVTALAPPPNPVINPQQP
jgi:cell division septation protein DedD